MINMISLDEVSSILWEKRGNDILIKSVQTGFTYKSFSQIEDVTCYTSKIKIELNHTSTIELSYENVISIEHDTEPSRNNTNKITINMINNQVLSIEYQL